MNLCERFEFDLQGYLVVKNVLTESEIAVLNEITDRNFKTYPYGEAIAGKETTLLPWGEPFRNLIDHPTVLPYLTDLLGSRLRLDHDYGMFMQKGDGHGGIHGGTGGSHWYHFRNGRMDSGLTVATFFLSDAPSGAGGFCCVPGSHKSNYSVQDIPEKVRDFREDAHYVVQPPVQAGDVLIFTEATMHGTIPWAADHERRAVLLKYSPGHSSWALDYYDMNAIPGLTAQQRRMMAPPSVACHPSVIEPPTE